MGKALIQFDWYSYKMKERHKGGVSAEEKSKAKAEREISDIYKPRREISEETKLANTLTKYFWPLVL